MYVCMSVNNSTVVFLESQRTELRHEHDRPEVHRAPAIDRRLQVRSATVCLHTIVSSADDLYVQRGISTFRHG